MRPVPHPPPKTARGGSIARVGEARRPSYPAANGPDAGAPHISSSTLKVSECVRRVIAPNPGPFTFTGTCSYIVGRGEVAIVDPGPDASSHIEALLDAVRGETVRYILVTHTHRDHSPAARALKEACGAIVAGCRAHLADPAGSGLDAAHDRSYAPDLVLREGDRLSLDDVEIEALETPGHTANHLCFALAAEKALFTGDHVMGWSTTVVAPPDGSMRAYLSSIERLRRRDDAILWPGHGDPVRDPLRFLRALLHHRRARETAIVERLAAGDDSVAAIVARLYERVDKRLHRAAALNVLAHLEDLIERGLVECDGPFGLDARFARKRGA